MGGAGLAGGGRGRVWEGPAPPPLSSGLMLGAGAGAVPGSVLRSALTRALASGDGGGAVAGTSACGEGGALSAPHGVGQHLGCLIQCPRVF